MITHKATNGCTPGANIIGYYESFDSANDAALAYVRSSDRAGFNLYADVRTVDNELIVRYDGNAKELHGDPGPQELWARKAMGWQVPKEPPARRFIVMYGDASVHVSARDEDDAIALVRAESSSAAPPEKPIKVVEIDAAGNVLNSWWRRDEVPAPPPTPNKKMLTREEISRTRDTAECYARAGAPCPTEMLRNAELCDMALALCDIVDAWRRYQQGDLSQEEFEGTMTERCG